MSYRKILFAFGMVQKAKVIGGSVLFTRCGGLECFGRILPPVMGKSIDVFESSNPD